MEAVKIVYTSFGRASSGLDVQALPAGYSPEKAVALARYRLSSDTIKATIYLDDGTTIGETWHPSVKVKPASKARAQATRKPAIASASVDAPSPAPIPESASQGNVEAKKPIKKHVVEAVFYYTGGGTKTAHYESTAQARSEAKHTLKGSQTFVRVVIGGKSISRAELIYSASSYDEKQANVESYWDRVRRENARV